MKPKDIQFCPSSKDGNGHCECWWDEICSCCWCNLKSITKENVKKHDLFESLSEEEYEKIKPPSKSKIKAALRDGSEDLKKAQSLGAYKRISERLQEAIIFIRAKFPKAEIREYSSEQEETNVALAIKHCGPVQPNELEKVCRMVFGQDPPQTRNAMQRMINQGIITVNEDLMMELI